MRVPTFATAAIAALSLVTVPTIAAAAPVATKLSVSGPAARVGATVANASEARGGKRGAGLIIAILAAAAIIAGIIIAADNNNNPTSR